MREINECMRVVGAAHRYRLRLAAVWQCCVIAGVFAHPGCADDDACDLGDISRELGGVGLIDCGISDSAEDTAAVDRCAVSAYAGGSTFRAVYERAQGGLEAIVRVAGGDYLVLRQSDDGGSVERADCASARVVDEAGRTYVECVDRGEFDPVCE